MIATEDQDLAARFLRSHHLDAQAPRAALLRDIGRAFAALPYENLTKILRHADAPRSRRSPGEVLEDHARWGTGGTCFSLTATLLSVLRGLGWTAEPLLADRSYGADTHCAVRIHDADRPWLIDPGYLVFDAVPLDLTEEFRVATAFHTLVFTPRGRGPDRLDLATEMTSGHGASLGACPRNPSGVPRTGSSHPFSRSPRRQEPVESAGFLPSPGDSDRLLAHPVRTHRLTFRLEPTSDEQFLRAWDASFDGEMLRYPLLTRLAGDTHLYLQGRRLQRRTTTMTIRSEASDAELVRVIREEFGIHPDVTRRALDTLARDA